jgi:hypothetical protein
MTTSPASITAPPISDASTAVADLDLAAEARAAGAALDRRQLRIGSGVAEVILRLDHAVGLVGALLLVQAGDLRQQRQPAVFRQQREEAGGRSGRRRPAAAAARPALAR